MYDTFFDKFLEVVMKTLVYVVIPMLMFILIVGFVGMVKDMGSEQISLTKKNWECTKYQTSMIYVQIGNVMVPQETKDCVQLTRK